MTRPGRPRPLAPAVGWPVPGPLGSRAPLLPWWIGVLAALGWLTVALATPMALGCSEMSPPACSAGSTTAVAALLVPATGARTSWMGFTTARAVRALRQVAVPPTLSEAALRIGMSRVSCLDTPARVAFCAGLWRPRVYVSVGLVAGLAVDELAAVLAHEHAHARRRDPLRGLLLRACADVAFFAPLLRWWQYHRQLHAELAADRAAVEHAGAPALAGALLRLVGAASVAPTGTAAFDPTASVLETRIATLTATTAPRQPLPVAAGVASTVGVLAAGVVVMCLPALLLVLE